MSIPIIDLRQQQKKPTARDLLVSGIGQFGTGLGEIVKDFTQQQATQKGLEATGIPPERAFAISKLSPKLQELVLGGTKGIAGKDLAPLLKTLGFKGKRAEALGKLFESVGTGGQTEVVKLITDEILREGISDSTDPISENADVEPNIDAQMPAINNFQGLTPKERVVKQSELFKFNSPFFRENKGKLNSFKSEGRSIEQLMNLNDSDKLPHGLGRINVDLKSGELRLPFLASKDAQLFVKTINDFTTKAKDSFGGRVTNFELNRFMKRLPTLLNSQEGRREILAQMNSINQLNQLESDSLKEVYRHYGLQNIDEAQADQIAENLRKPKEDRLIRDFFRAPQAQEIFEAKKQLPPNKILIEINGKIGSIPLEQKEQALAQGADLL